MATEVILPRVDMDMTTGQISRWFAEEGATVSKGQPLFEIETDKAAMDIDAPASGILRGIAPTGTQIPVGQAVGWIYAEGEAEVAHEPAKDLPAAAEVVAAIAVSAAIAAEPVSTTATTSGPATAGDIRATPLARRLARQRGLDLSSIAGSGPKGRIQAKDLPSATADVPLLPAEDAPPFSAAAPAVAGPVHHVWLRPGSGTPLVLIHGFGADLNIWRPVIGDRQLGRPILGLDLPAHGQSGDPVEPGLDGLVSAVADVLKALAIESADLVGHSLGGAVATRLAASGAFTARSLLLLAPAGLGPEINGDFIAGFSRSRSEASLGAWMQRLTADPAVLSPAFVKATAKQRADGTLGARQMRLAGEVFPDGTQGFSIRADLARLTCPTRIIFGLADEIIPARQLQGLPGRIAQHLFPGIGHMPQLEARDAVLDILSDILH